MVSSMTYASWGAILWPFLKRSAPTTKAARGTVATKDIAEKERGLSVPVTRPSAPLGASVPLTGHFSSSIVGFSRTKNHFGTDIPWTSGGHSRGHPGPKLRSGPSKSWKKNKHFGADIHDPKGRTSTTPRDFQKLRSEKLWAEFSFPSFGLGAFNCQGSGCL